jgi:hypothetical protein
MNIKKVISISCLIITAVVFMSAAFKGEKDPLHKRTFTIGITEVKDGIPGKKSIADEITFKDGKLYSDFLANKFQYKWIKYRINKDSIYIDSTETEVRLLEVEASTTDENNTTMMINFAVEEWDIVGTFKQTKNDKLKKFFDFTGFEKGGKPKKEKKPKVDPNKPAEQPKPEEQK